MSKTLHAWQRPENISLEELSADESRQVASMADALPSLDERMKDRLENEFLNLGLPFASLDAALDLVEDVVAVKVAGRAADALRELLWKLGKEGAAIRRALLKSDESLRDAAELDGIPKSTLARKAAAVLKKWDSRTPLLKS